MVSTVPLYVNAGASVDESVKALLARDERVEIHDVDAALLTERIRKEVDRGQERILVAGGDGSIAAGAQAVAGTGAVLGVIPFGTLNHFAKDCGIPLDPAEALDVALGPSVRSVDAASINGRIFLNTSSVGGYVKFVRIRSRHRRWCGYFLSSVIAAAGVMAKLPRFQVALQVEGTERRYHTPLVFVGVGERETKLPDLGSRVEGGRSGLHVLIVRGGTRARLLTLALAAAAHGLRRISRTPHVDTFLVDACTVELAAAEAFAGVDGELEPFRNPLRYRLEPRLIRVAM